MMGHICKWAIFSSGFVSLTQKEFLIPTPLPIWPTLTLLYLAAFIMPIWDWLKLGEHSSTELPNPPIKQDGTA
jgi:hypothetical protein